MRRRVIFAACLLGMACAVSAQVTPAERALRFADALYGRGDYELAVREYRDFLSRFPSDGNAPVVRYRLGSGLFQMGQFEEARKVLLETLTESEEPERQARTRLLLGRIADELSRPEEAVRHLRESLKLNPPPEIEEAVRYHLGSACIDAGSDALAVEVWQESLKRFPEGDFRNHTSLALAEPLQRLGRGKEAAEVLLAFSERVAASTDARLLEQGETALLAGAQLMSRENEPLRAAGMYGHFMEWYPRSSRTPQALFGWGRELYVAGNRAEAIRILRRMESLPREAGREDLDLSARFLLGSALFEEGIFQDAVGPLRAVVEAGETPHFSQAVRLLGQALYRMEQYEETVALADAVVARLNDTPETKESLLFLKGQALVSLGRHSEALLTFAAFVSTFPESPMTPRAVYQIGRSGLLMGEYGRAAENLIRYVDTYPAEENAPDALFFAAEALHRENRTERAIGVFRRLLNDYPKSSRRKDALARLAAVEFRMDRPDAAFETYGRLFEEFPESPEAGEALFYRGFLESRKGRHEEAARFFGDLVERFPDSPRLPDARLRMGLAQYHSGNEEAAVESLLTLVKDRSRATGMDGNTYLWLGSMFEKSGRWEDALLVYDRAGEESVSREVRERTLFGRGQALFELGRHESAHPLLTRYLEDYPNGSYGIRAAYFLGRSAQELGRPVEAEKAYRKALETSDVVLALRTQYYLAEVLRTQGKFREAFEAFWTVAVLYDEETLVPKAYLAAGEIQAEHFDTNRSQAIYRELVEKYPESPEAALAGKRIQ